MEIFISAIPSWKKLQLSEKLQPGLKIFQRELKYIRLMWIKKLMTKRKHIQIRTMLWKPSAYWYKKNTTEEWWLKLIGKKTSASSWKKNIRMTKDSFMKFMELLNSSKPFIGLISLLSIHLKRACRVAIFIFLKNDK